MVSSIRLPMLGHPSRFFLRFFLSNWWPRRPVSSRRCVHVRPRRQRWMGLQRKTHLHCCFVWMTGLFGSVFSDDWFCLDQCFIWIIVLFGWLCSCLDDCLDQCFYLYHCFLLGSTLLLLMLIIVWSGLMLICSRVGWVPFLFIIYCWCFEKSHSKLSEGEVGGQESHSQTHTIYRTSQDW